MSCIRKHSAGFAFASCLAGLALSAGLVSNARADSEPPDEVEESGTFATRGADSDAADSAQEPPRETSPIHIDLLWIVGGLERIQDVPGSVQELDSGHLEQHGHTDAMRVLRAVPGVSVAEEDGHGQFPHISMRGTPPERNSRITVMEDGVLIAPAPYAAPAAYYFPPIERMDSIEIQKGASAILHGPYTTGGAINMRSTPIPRDTRATYSMLLGSYDGRRIRADVGGTEELSRAGEIGWLVQGLTSQSDGFKVIDNPLAGPNQPELGSGFDRRNVLAKLRWNTDPSASLFQSVELKYANDRRRVDDTYLGLTQADFDATPLRRYAGSMLDEINTRNDLLTLQHVVLPTPHLDITTTLYRTDTVRNWYKLHEVAGDAVLDRNQTLSEQGSAFVGISSILDEPTRDENVADAFAWIQGQDTGIGAVRANNREYYAMGADLRASYRFDLADTSHEVDAGVRLHRDEEDRFQWQDYFAMSSGQMALVERGEPGTTTNRLTTADAIATYARNTMRWGPASVTAGARFESIEIRRRDWSGPQREPANQTRNDTATYNVFIPGVGATYEFLPGLSALAGVHRGFAPGGTSPDSRAERSLNFEAGIRHAGRATRAEAIGFFNAYSNINIECTAVGGGCDEAEIGDVVSAGEVDIYGLETLVLHDLGHSLGLAFGIPLSLAYTMTLSEFKQDIGANAPNQWANAQRGERLPEIPQHEVNLTAGVRQPGWQINATGNVVSPIRAKADPALRQQRIDGRFLLDVAGEYNLRDGIRVFAAIENLTDATYIVHHRPAGARPGKPRELWAGVRGEF